MKYKLIFLNVLFFITCSIGYCDDTFDPGACVECKNTVGIVATEVIKQMDGREWFIIYTPEKTLPTYASELVLVPCSSILNSFSDIQKEAILRWLEGGINPILIDLK